ncbi:hypothetical protein QE152_g23597 [Popillia japonica]|uniref:Uncharacterized protein n=1 Tax=Popillia japonica TaxID=7064 RepID=A0AAW1KH36_POPJA
MADEIKIPIFDCKEYECWKKRIMMILKLKKCQEVVTSERTETEKEDEWDAKDLKAIDSGCSSDHIINNDCSDHIINNDKYFSDFVELKEPVNVKVGDGRCLKVS